MLPTFSWRLCCTRTGRDERVTEHVPRCRGERLPFAVARSGRVQLGFRHRCVRMRAGHIWKMPLFLYFEVYGHVLWGGGGARMALGGARSGLIRNFVLCLYPSGCKSASCRGSRLLEVVFAAFMRKHTFPPELVSSACFYSGLRASPRGALGGQTTEEQKRVLWRCSLCHRVRCRGFVFVDAGLPRWDHDDEPGPCQVAGKLGEPTFHN